MLQLLVHNGLNIGVVALFQVLRELIGQGAGAFVQKGVASCSTPTYNERRR